MKKLKGLSLIEIMVTLAVIGTISAIAYPTYTQYRNKNVITDGILAAEKAKISILNTFIEEQSLDNASGSSTFKNGSINWVKGKITITYQDKNNVCTVTAKDGGCGQLVITATKDTSNNDNPSLVWVCTNNADKPLKAEDSPKNCPTS